MQRAFLSGLESLLDGYAGALLLAVSGGVDSMTMLHLAAHTLPAGRLAVAHVNFSLREGDCDLDQALVRNACAGYGIPFYTKKFDTRAYAAGKGISIEMAARELRYGWFSELMEAEGFGRLLVAHNQGDAAETLLLNLTRGTGLRGLAGIRAAGGRIIRPMLGFSREQIERYAAENGVAFREDYTNADISIPRNRIRHRVLKELAAINPSVLDTLTAEMQRFAQAEAVLDEMFAQVCSRLCISQGDALCISIAGLEAEPHRDYWLYRLLAPYGFTASQMADVQQSASAQSGKQFLSGTHRLIRDREFYKIYPLPGRGEGSVEVDVFPLEAGFDPRKAPAGVLYADADTLSQPLKCRPWRQGDRFRPLGMRGSRLVSDFFTDLKLDLEQKSRARIVFFEDAAGEHIVAVAGIATPRIDDRYKITPATGRVAAIRIG